MSFRGPPRSGFHARSGSVAARTSASVTPEVPGKPAQQDAAQSPLVPAGAVAEGDDDAGRAVGRQLVDPLHQIEVQLVRWVVEYRMCLVLCSSASRSAAPKTLSDAFVMPSNRHLDRSNGVVSVLVNVKSCPSQTQMSVSVPPLSMLIRRSMGFLIGFGECGVGMWSRGCGEGLLRRPGRLR